MRHRFLLSATMGAMVALSGSAVRGADQEAPKVKVPEPGVPQIMTLEGRYVRAAYNNEGYVILGYRNANLSVGEPWMLLEVGMTLRDEVPNYTLKRDDISLDAPDGRRVPLPTVAEYRKADVRAMEQRSKVQRDSINYFPPGATQACRLGFFAEPNAPVMSFDQSELTSKRACLGRLFFEVPGGIAYGQYWLNVKFASSTVRVPFRILTKEEDKLLEKNYRDIKKQVDEAFKPRS